MLHTMTGNDAVTVGPAVAVDVVDDGAEGEVVVARADEVDVVDR